MSFRQNNQDRQVWSRFRRTHQDLLLRTGLPAHIVDNLEVFWDFLMHGYLDHHADPAHFHIRQLTPQQYAQVLELLLAYFAASLPDPGVDAISRQERQRLARDYPHVPAHWRDLRHDEPTSSD